MNTLRLHSNGVLTYRENSVTNEPLPYLGFQMMFSADCTLRSFFRMLDRYPALIKLNPFCESFVTHYNTFGANGCLCDGVECLELTRTVEMIGYPGDPSMQLFVSLEGRCGTDRCDIKPYWLEHLLDMPLQLGRLTHCIFGDKVDTFDFETSFNLFEVIDSICWQLSFHNLPAQCRIDI